MSETPRNRSDFAGIQGRRSVADILLEKYPGYSSCQSCFWPWAVRDGYDISISDRDGMFPVCRDCWKDLIETNQDDEILRCVRASYLKYWQDDVLPWSVYEAATLREIALCRGEQPKGPLPVQRRKERLKEWLAHWRVFEYEEVQVEPGPGWVRMRGRLECIRFFGFIKIPAHVARWLYPADEWVL